VNLLTSNVITASDKQEALLAEMEMGNFIHVIINRCLKYNFRGGFSRRHNVMQDFLDLNLVISTL